jgi:hypothetical protein
MVGIVRRYSWDRYGIEFCTYEWQSIADIESQARRAVSSYYTFAIHKCKIQSHIYPSNFSGAGMKMIRLWKDWFTQGNVQG